MNLSILARCGLFRGIETVELSPLLRRLHACTREFDKFQPIYRVGDTAHALCILLSGGVNIERCDAWGHKTLLDRITPGSVFAETYACVPGTPMMVSAVADEPSEVLFLPSETLLSSAAQDSAHSVLLRNLLGRHCAEKPAFDAKNLSHKSEIHAWQAAVVPVRTGGAARLRHVRHSVRPSAAGRLPRRGPQCAVRRAEPHAARRTYRIQKEPFCAQPFPIR